MESDFIYTNQTWELLKRAMQHGYRTIIYLPDRNDLIFISIRNRICLDIESTVKIKKITSFDRASEVDGRWITCSLENKLTRNYFDTTAGQVERYIWKNRISDDAEADRQINVTFNRFVCQLSAFDRRIILRVIRDSDESPLTGDEITN